MPSFDIVSEVDLSEVENACANVMREIGTRYDFKGSSSEVTADGAVISIKADDDMKLNQVHEVLRGHLQRRGIEPGQLDMGKVEQAAGQSVRQTVKVIEGIDTEMAKKIVKEIKAAKLKVQASIQGDSVRVTGKKRDDLQEAIALVKSMKLDQPTQYKNFRD
ncbi:YajQ family cyclic di-GMP-binding protein [Parvularcula sp. LCG005]|uniref:YajQ family cyclic di-GMP-binding protein n=1 Tax=Parvularcula sp. LCG005 TaxID=3078805 RepID=UPI00294335DF|nr:YajQ family cyclic di-GMP-binding protein [Parvularcula sp. LCG005]WOI52283.1 YajQ family cyclic di-GMP-binding protein [Parvularcula sp. LCG005]